MSNATKNIFAVSNDIISTQIEEEKRVILTTINQSPIYRNFIKNLPKNPGLNKFVRDKRKEGILSEVLFWQKVHKGKFHKIDFDRQRIIGN